MPPSRAGGKPPSASAKAPAAPLDDREIELIRAYGSGPFDDQIAAAAKDIEALSKRVSALIGMAESDTGLSLPSTWALHQDQMLLRRGALQVAQCTTIIDPNSKSPKYVVVLQNIAKFVVGLHSELSPTDVEEGMRVAIQRGARMQIMLPLPKRIDPSVSMMTVEEKPDVTFDDVGGMREQLQQLREVVEYPLLHPERYEALGITPPKGVMLYGPPGTGKTLCARAIANRTEAVFIRVIGSELVQKYTGEGARMVRELFSFAQSKRSAIIFFDEIDAIGGHRFSQDDGGDNEVQRTMLELVNQLDGFEARGNIKVVMATNRPDTLDPALIRPGRIDRRVEFGLPELEGRAHILRIHAGKMSLAPGIRFDLLARLCEGTTGAELKSVCTEAGIFAIRSRRKAVSEKDFLKAVNKVIKGYGQFSSTSQYLYYN